MSHTLFFYLWPRINAVKSDRVLASILELAKTVLLGVEYVDQLLNIMIQDSNPGPIGH